MKRSLQYLISTALALLLITAFNSMATAQIEYTNDNWNWQTSRPGVTLSSLGPSRDVRAVVTVDNLIYTAGKFDLASDDKTSNFAIHDHTTRLWIADDNGPDDPIYAMVRVGNLLYAGGSFQEANGNPAGRMAVYDLTSGVWSPFDVSFNDEVSVLLEHDGYLYIAGRFTQADEMDVNYIVRYNLETGAVENMSGGLGPAPNGLPTVLPEDMKAIDGNIWVAGQFRRAGGLLAWNVAIYNPAENSWESPYTDQFSGGVLAIAYDESFIYLSGQFLFEEGGSNSNRIVRADRETLELSAVGGLFPDESQLRISALHRKGDYLYAGGQNWAELPGNPAEMHLNAARFHLPSETWESLNRTIAFSSTSRIEGFTNFGEDVLVFGRFRFFDRIEVNNILRVRHSTGETVSLGEGLNSDVHSLAAEGNTLYLGGYFSSTGSEYSLHMGAMNLNTRNWIKTQISGVPFTGGSGRRYKVHVHDDAVYLGGTFTAPEGFSEWHGIRRYIPDSGEWEPLVQPGTVCCAVRSMVNNGDDIYMGGSTRAGNVTPPDNNISRYHVPTGTFHSVGGGVSGIRVNILLLHDDYLYAGGFFDQAGDLSVSNLARYNINNDEWEAFGPVNLNGGVTSLYVYNEYLYVGGFFTSATGVTDARYIIKYNLNSGEWSSAGNLMNISNGIHVRTMSEYQGELFIGGLFSGTSNHELNNIARLSQDELQWLPVGSGIDGQVNAMLPAGIDLWIGGDFQRAGDKPASHIARLRADLSVSVEPEHTENPSRINLHQNYPNPFNPATIIRYELSQSETVNLDIFDMIGQRVAVLVNGAQQSSGTYTVSFDASWLSSGMYLYRLRAGNEVITRKMMLVK